MPAPRSSALSRRGFLTASLGAAGALALSGCASSPLAAGLVGSRLNPQTLVFWNLFGGGDGSRMQTMEAGYRKTHGGASSLQATTFAWGNPYYSKLTLATVGNKPPDVAVAHLTRAKPLWDGGILDPITEDDLASVGLSGSDFSQRPWAAQKTDGENIAIPLDTHPIVVFYNVDVCRKAGLIGADGKLVSLDGMDAFEAALAAASKATGGLAITSANSGGETATPWRLFTSLYNQISGAKPFLSDGGADISVSMDAYTEVTSRIQKWAKQGWLNTSLDYGSAESDMFTGKAAFYIEGEWEITTAQSVKGLDFGMAPFPRLYDKNAVQADSHTFVLPKKDRTPDQRKQAMGFIKSMLDQSLTWAQGGHIPAYLPVQDSAAYKKLEPQADYAPSADYAVYDPPAWYGGSGSNFENIVGAQLGLIQQLAVSPAEGMSAMRSQLAVYTRTPSPL